MNIPESIGRYRIKHLLGQGGMGAVYLGHDPKLDRHVAIKLIRHQETGSDSFIQRFTNEAKAAAKINHPAIVQIHDVGEQEGVGPYLVFEYVPGPSLKQWLVRHGKLTVDQTLSLLTPVAEALDLAHHHGILHRDVKPENILIHETGFTAKLADFGIARLPNEDLTKEGQFLGTPSYAAPETLVGEPYSPKSDQFSFACTLYEALTHEKPFPGHDAFSVVTCILHQDPKPPSFWSESLSGLDEPLLKGLSKKPLERFESLGMLMAGIHSHEALRGPTPRPAFHPSNTPNPSNGSRVGPYLIIGTLITLFILGLWYLKQERPALVNGNHAPHASQRSNESFFLNAPDDGGTISDAPSGLLDVNIDGNDVFVEPPKIPNSNFEREERAKDLFAQAQIHLRNGNMQEALKAWQMAVQLDPSNKDIAEASEFNTLRPHP